ncbi:MAG: hypothetical protein GW878_02095 [Acidobacteria bacterium]|nr:hypothetical protein [Acidobacteriota bacterium]
MAHDRKASIAKRERERAQQTKKKDKAEKRRLRHEERATRAPGDQAVDPDIAGMVPGPQTPQWLDDMPVATDDDTLPEA